MSIAVACPQCLAIFGTRRVIEPSRGQFSVDVGSFSIRQIDTRNASTLITTVQTGRKTFLME